MSRIWKFSLTPDVAEQTIEVPAGASFLSVQMQAGRPCLWFVVSPERERVPVSIEIVGTGWPMDLLGKAYLGTVQDGAFVWHIFTSGHPTIDFRR